MRLLAALALLVLPSLCSAQYLYIPPQHRVTQPPGTCMWQCVESLARTHGYHAVNGRAAYQLRVGQGGATQHSVRPVLNAARVPYACSSPGAYNWGALQRHARTGAIVGVQTPRGGHAVVVVGVNSARVRFWDPSAPGVLGSVTRREFRRDWFGNSLTIYRARKSGHPPASCRSPKASRMGRTR